ncbi:MAG: tripartite tricarboxylate transporter substrate-binding protein [Xanthobacteraceae bacterium]
MRRAILAAAAILALGFGTAHAQSYPSRPITIVVPFAAGGPTDVIGRALAERMRASLGQPVLIENVTGAGGSIGVARAVQAAPDGYTISMGNTGTHVAAGAIYPLKFDLLTDLEPLALIATNPMVVVTKNALPAKNLGELIALLKANAGQVPTGTAGVGSASHLAGVYFQVVSGTKLNFVPYRGTGPALQDLVAGQIDVIVDQASNSMNQIKAGSIKALAVSGDKRLAGAPDVPTADEAGLPAFQVSVWNAFWMPKGTPKDVTAKLSAAVMNALADPTVRQRLVDLGLEIPAPAQQTPEALGKYHKAEIEKWWPIIKAANIKPE